MKEISRISIIFLFFSLNLALASCKSRVYKIVLDKKNPVEYIFNTQEDHLYETIISKLNFEGLLLPKVKIKILRPDILELYPQTANDKDVFLWSISSYCKSKIYKNKDGAFFDYEVSFYLHIEAIDETHTKVSIKTIDPKIVIGRELLPSLPHMVRKDRTIDVEPSTIEEYELLLEIGNSLNEMNMPSIILPNDKSKTELKKP